jgi:hypothetical protein
MVYKNSNGLKFHPNDQIRLNQGRLKLITAINLSTGKYAKVLDPTERVRAKCTSYRDMLSLIEVRATINKWFDDEMTLSTLWDQIQSGETVFSVNGTTAHTVPLIRDVDGVNVEVTFINADGIRLQLVEDSVQYDNEQIPRHRAYPYISGKCRFNEFAHKAAHRELGEETDIQVNPQLLKPCGLRKVSRNSPLFPGIKSVYWFRLFRVTIGSNAYKPLGYETYKNGVRSKFIWIRQDEVPAWVASRLISTTVRDEILPNW